MSESLIGPGAVVELAQKEMSAADRREFGNASPDVRAYLTAVSEAIAYLICDWYALNEEPNRAAISQAAGETLHAVRSMRDDFAAIKSHLERSAGPELAQLEGGTSESSDRKMEVVPERVLFELDFGFAPLAADAEIADIVRRAVVAVIEDRSVYITVSLPSLDEDVTRLFGDAIHAAQQKRQYQDRARRIELVLSAFFSPQVESAWGEYLTEVQARVTVVRAILALARPTVSGSKLDVWRTTPPVASAPIWLSPDEVAAVVKAARLERWDDLRLGAGWRAADELPRSLKVEKLFASILAELARQKVTHDESWPASVLFLPSWHIGQG